MFKTVIMVWFFINNQKQTLQRAKVQQIIYLCKHFENFFYIFLSKMYFFVYCRCNPGSVCPLSPLAFFSILFLVFLFLVSLSLVPRSLFLVPCSLLPLIELKSSPRCVFCKLEITKRLLKAKKWKKNQKRFGSIARKLYFCTR